MIADILQGMGVTKIFEASAAYMGIEVLTKVKEGGEKVDLIFSDWNMPGLSGYDFLKIAKDDPKWAKIPFVMVTAEGEPTSVMSAVRAGAFDYVIKPIVPETIVAIVKRVRDL
jgi:two-component system chemotaxis response regulator CheY